jgi:hypothetical protein
MKKTISCLLLLFCLHLFCTAQKDSTFFGKWQIIIEASNKNTTPTYMLLSPDSTFVTSGDSTFSDYNKKASQGKWKLSSTGDIVLIPTDTSHETHYYKHVSGWKYKYSETEKHGVRTPVYMLEMDIYIEKLGYSSVPKKKKKKH